MIAKMGIEPTNYPCAAGCATLNTQLVYSVSNQSNCVPWHYLSMSASSLPYRNTLVSWDNVDFILNVLILQQRLNVFLYGRTARTRTEDLQVKSLML